jgi:DNA-binding CsgD family transcriptional regulator
VLGRVAAASGSPLLVRYSAFATALLPADDDRDARFRVGLRSLDGDPYLRARLRVEYGGWLRRSRRVRESRSVLHEARAELVACAASRWVEQVDRELLAAGAKAVAGTGPATLTPQEAAVARLVATGLSNRDTAERLSISPRTVSTHLHRIFRKLGVLGRAELAGALEREAPAPV